MAFEYPTNFSNETSVDGIGNLLVYANYVCNGWFAYGFLAIIFLMSWVVSMGLSSRKSLLSASFITFVFSVYFMMIKMVSFVVPVMLAILLIVGALLSKEENTVNV